MSERQSARTVSQEIRTNSQFSFNKGLNDDNDERQRQMKHLEELQRELAEMKKKLNDAGVRCHKLNIDVATMFNPEILATLEDYEGQCDVCLQRMSETLNEPAIDVDEAEDDAEKEKDEAAIEPPKKHS